ncbi:MAG: hypothetical protein ABI846_08945 [Rudaea sp.]
MRVLYYAIGGGLGHLVRARAFLHTLGLGADATLLTASGFADDRRVIGDLDVLRPPLELQEDAAALREWLQSELARRRIDVLCVDAFPAGILGELCDLRVSGAEWWHVARLLRWPDYAAMLRGRPPRYARCWRLEALAPDHQAFLDAHCARIDDLALTDAPAAGAIEAILATNDEVYWLVVHSGPKSEVDELVAFAREVRDAEGRDVPLRVVSPHATSDPAANVQAIDLHPADALFAGAQRIFSAAGFNVMRQTQAHRARQRVLPMPRRFDDQFERARRAFSSDGGA